MPQTSNLCKNVKRWSSMGWLIKAPQDRWRWWEKRNERLTLCCIVLHTSLWEPQRNEEDTDLIGHRRNRETERENRGKRMSISCRSKKLNDKWRCWNIPSTSLIPLRDSVPPAILYKVSTMKSLMRLLPLSGINSKICMQTAASPRKLARSALTRVVISSESVRQNTVSEGLSARRRVRSLLTESFFFDKRQPERTTELLKAI